MLKDRVKGSDSLVNGSFGANGDSVSGANGDHNRH